MRFGINMNTDHTLEEVSEQFDVTRERIRQIEAKARKLRHPSRAEMLRSCRKVMSNARQFNSIDRLLTEVDHGRVRCRTPSWRRQPSRKRQ